MAKLVGLLILAAACAAAQSVEGSVFDAATGAGAAGVRVELLKGGTPFYETTTDGGGRFRFDNVREGEYAARYQSPDYWLTAGPSDYRYFHIGGAEPVKLTARLMPWSTISGRVVDARGNGVANARVEMTGSGMVANGRTYLRTSWGGGGGGQLNIVRPGMPFPGNSDAQGRFEVKVMPGAYMFSVVAPPELKPPVPEEGGPVLAWIRTYYPGVAAPDAASKVAVLPGAQISLELKLLAVPAHVVRGVVLYPDGTPAPKASIVLGDLYRAVPVPSKDDGSFEFPAVPEGEWRLMAEAERGGVKLRAHEWIEVTRHDVENVKLRLTPPVALRGKVIMEAPKDGSTLRPMPFILSLRGGHVMDDTDRMAGPGEVALIEPDLKGGILDRDYAYPGTYGLSAPLQPPPPPYYLDAIRIGDVDVLLQDVEIATDANITVVYKTDGGSVAGKAEGCASGGVLLVPADPARRRPGLSYSGACDANDRYEVRAVRPGDYFALAFAGNGPVVTVDEQLLNQAVKVTVHAGEASSADLRAVTKPVY
jgi:hypothetical protein